MEELKSIEDYLKEENERFMTYIRNDSSLTKSVIFKTIYWNWFLECRCPDFSCYLIDGN